MTKQKTSVGGVLVAREPVGSPTARVVHLSDPEMKPFMDEIKHRVSTDPVFARQLLRDAGILTPTGRLARRFGG